MVMHFCEPCKSVCSSGKGGEHCVYMHVVMYMQEKNYMCKISPASGLQTSDFERRVENYQQKCILRRIFVAVYSIKTQRCVCVFKLLSVCNYCVYIISLQFCVSLSLLDCTYPGFQQSNETQSKYGQKCYSSVVAFCRWNFTGSVC